MQLVQLVQGCDVGWHLGRCAALGLGCFGQVGRSEVAAGGQAGGDGSRCPSRSQQGGQVTGAGQCGEAGSWAQQTQGALGTVKVLQEQGG